MTTTGAILRKLRDSKGMSQVELAEAIQCDRSSLSKWENDKAPITYQGLVAAADYFGVLTDYIACRTNIKSLGLNGFADDLINNPEGAKALISTANTLIDAVYKGMPPEEAKEILKLVHKSAIEEGVKKLKLNE